MMVLDVMLIPHKYPNLTQLITNLRTLPTTLGRLTMGSVGRVVGGEEGSSTYECRPKRSEEKELKGTKKKKKLTTPISATSNFWLDYSLPLQTQLCHNIDLICTIT